MAAPGKQAVGNDLRFQATITKTARECTINGGEITARIGIQGRVIAGPAGAPASVQVPLRVAVVQGGVGEKVIATKAYQTTVDDDRRAAASRLRWWPRIWSIRRRRARSATATSSISASTRRR